MQEQRPDEANINFLKGFDTFAKRSEKERELRVENGKHHLTFGVPFLDECLGGIFNNDLIILGAKTGFGKSQLASLIAMESVKLGKRVHFFALEAEEYEVERRIKYQYIAERFYKLQSRPPFKLNYMDWYYGKLDKYLDAIEIEVQEQLRSLENLHTYYRHGEFDIKEFERIALAIKSQTDLIILDHLHYFDYDDQNENKAVKDTVKRIRDIALITGKPIILISHVRKTDKRIKQLIPDIEDFHGSSDIGKIGTKAITIAPCYEEKASNHRKTYFQAVKCRVDGSRQSMTGLLAFNTSHHKYERQYYLGKLSIDGTEFKPFSFNEMPHWAINGVAAHE